VNESSNPILAAASARREARASPDAGTSGAGGRQRFDPAQDLPGLLLLASALGFFLLDAWQLRHPLDDAYISYRYAQNWVDGSGLVYNPGEYVEGFTNLLWTVLVAGGIVLGLPAPGAGWCLGVASGIGALAATWALARSWLPADRAALAGLAPWIVLASPAFPRWALSGLETPLYVAWVTAAIAALASGRMAWTTVFAVLATLTRPDGALLAGVLLGLHFLAERGRGQSAWAPIFVYAGALALLTGFRLAYYGSPVPNTYFAKVGGIPMIFGVHHVRAFLEEGPAFLLLPAAFAVARIAATRPAAIYAGVVVGYIIWIGGDVFAHRFLLPLLPALAAMGVCGAERLAAERGGLVAVGVGCLVAAFVQMVWGSILVTAAFGGAASLLALAWIWLRRGRSLSALGAGAAATLSLATLAIGTGEGGRAWEGLATPYRTRTLASSLKIDRGFEARGMRSARVLRERREPLRLVAAGAIGAFGYYSRLPILDLYGLVDPVIARTRSETATRRGGLIPGHQRSNPNYVLSRRPDYILMPRRDPASAGLVPAHDALWAHPGLDRWYEWDDEVPAYRRRANPSRAPHR
jgi:hypothetical protein